MLKSKHPSAPQFLMCTDKEQMSDESVNFYYIVGILSEITMRYCLLRFHHFFVEQQLIGILFLGLSTKSNFHWNKVHVCNNRTHLEDLQPLSIKLHTSWFLLNNNQWYSWNQCNPRMTRPKYLSFSLISKYWQWCKELSIYVKMSIVYFQFYNTDLQGSS